MYYNLTRTARRTAAINIRNGVVYVRAPFFMPRRVIDQFVMEKAPWIKKNLTKQIVETENKEAFALDYGSFLTLRGKTYPVLPREDKYAEFDEGAFYMPPGLPPEQLKTLCIRLYIILAQMHITKRVHFYALRMKAEPKAIKINSATKRWGSCSSLGNLNFSWRLIMADDEVIDYVVVHELAHLIEMNHSPRFWAVIRRIIPDYEECKEKLKQLQSRLDNEDWE